LKTSKETGLAEKGSRAFTNMLTSTSRNHYTLNQMVDRKARILLSVNILILSLIVGEIIGGRLIYDLNFYLLVDAGIFCAVSIICSILAVKPENVKNDLSVENIKNGTINPLHFGNYLNMPKESYVNTIMEMKEDADFAHRAILKDIYHIGTVLERKRKYLKYSLLALAIGVCTTLILSLIFRIILTSH